jgi:hypothetical protein
LAFLFLVRLVPSDHLVTSVDLRTHVLPGYRAGTSSAG